MTSAVFYARFSDRPDADLCKSIENQVDSMSNYARTFEYTVEGSYNDPAASGFSRKKRPGLEKALEHVCRIKGVLVVYKIDRLSRNLRDLLDISQEIQDCGADLASVTERFDTSTAMGKAMFQVMGVFAELWRNQTSERTRDALRNMQANGKSISSRPPYGMEFDPESPMRTRVDHAGNVVNTVPERMRPNKAEQRVIKRILKLQGKGEGLRAICRALEVKGITHRGGKWHHGQIKSIIGNGG